MDAQIAQTVMFKYAQYMGNHIEYFLAPHAAKSQLHIMP